VFIFTTSFYYYQHGLIKSDEIDLLLFYGSFDEDRDGTASTDEIIAFFDWVKDNIEYEAHTNYQSPVETFKTKRGDCLDQSLLLAHFLYVYFRVEGLIGSIAAENKGTQVNHACCLMPVTKEAKERINKHLGYKVDYFDVPYNNLCYIILDPLYVRRFSELRTYDYCLKDIRGLHDHHFKDMTTIYIGK
jgi:hypothetical protein